MQTVIFYQKQFGRADIFGIFGLLVLNINGKPFYLAKFSNQYIISCSAFIFGQGTVPRADLPGRPLELYMCSVLKRQGYGEGFRWLAQYID